MQELGYNSNWVEKYLTVEDPEWSDSTGETVQLRRSGRKRN